MEDETTTQSKKRIAIQGVANRYQIKKLVNRNKEQKIRKETEKWGFSSITYEEANQHILIKELYQGLAAPCKSEDSNSPKPNFSQECDMVRRQIEKKLQGYKQQDVEKERFVEADFVSLEEVIGELYDSKLECHYCSKVVYLLYEMVRENSQWTLDRLDNNIGHNRGNVVISCLGCNLKRRRTNKDAFLFTKKLQLVKTSSEV